ncbi:MAG: sigma-70 family RNA polymerase sigma factor [Bacteroidales bacterium]|jgi:RNA polymerase sigma-70 factor (ECF subfamily)|nr:sigma-70 family RNA polymerase sigma factor [Bacteroidales bacterium]
MMGNIIDKTLLDGCLQNDRKSQKELYDKFAPKMLGICMRYAHSKDEAEDILTDSFVAVFQNLSQFKGDSPLEYWIKSIVTHKAISNYRANAKHYHNISIDEFDYEQLADETINVETHINQKKLMETIRNMPDYLRIILNMRAFEGMEYTAIAQLLKIKEVTCRARFAKAKKWLEEELGVRG